MAKIVRFHEAGGPDVLRVEQLAVPKPGPGEARLRVKAIGLNYGEVMFRKDEYYEAPNLPARNGYEASGVIDAVGPGVDPGLVGQIRSTLPVFSLNDYGVYGEVAVVPADALASYPDAMSFEEGAGIWMQYLTAYGALVHHAHVGAGDHVVLTAATGSVGPGAIQITKALGGTVIATTRSRSKADALHALGADHVIVTAEEDLSARILDITDGAGADVVFDSVGGDTIRGLATAMADDGLIILYGLLSEQPPPFPIYESWSLGAQQKSFKMMGYSVFEITGRPEVLRQGVAFIQEQLAAGALKPRIDRTFPLDEIAAAHRYMESGQQTGKIIVTP